MIRHRERKKTDDENVIKGVNLLFEVINENQDIEPVLWTASMWITLVKAYSTSGFTHEQFEEEAKKAIKHYKSWFKNE